MRGDGTGANQSLGYKTSETCHKYKTLKLCFFLSVSNMEMRDRGQEVQLNLCRFLLFFLAVFTI